MGDFKAKRSNLYGCSLISTTGEAAGEVEVRQNVRSFGFLFLLPGSRAGADGDGGAASIRRGDASKTLQLAVSVPLFNGTARFSVNDISKICFFAFLCILSGSRARVGYSGGAAAVRRGDASAGGAPGGSVIGRFDPSAGIYMYIYIYTNIYINANLGTA